MAHFDPVKHIQSMQLQHDLFDLNKAALRRMATANSGFFN
jgi:hypothetical protein